MKLPLPTWHGVTNDTLLVLRLVLQLVRDMVAVGWTNKGYARTWDGRPCCWSSEYAASICLTGGLQRAIAHCLRGQAQHAETVHDLCLDLLEHVCPPLAFENTEFLGFGSSMLETFNDRYARDADDVVALLDRALAMLPMPVVDTRQLELPTEAQPMLPGLM